jgi:hypothetical protein
VPKTEYTKIHAELLASYDQREVAEHWQSYNSIYPQLYYHRSKTAPKIPKGLVDILITGQYRETTTGKPFLR